MRPVALQIPGLESKEFVIAKDQPEYIPLPALPIHSDMGPGVLTRWEFTLEEREQIAKGADLWVQHLTFGGPLQPVAFTIECPIVPPTEPS